jgi:hypothetical protein
MDLDVGLHPGERIVWNGRPVRSRLLQPADAMMIPFSLLWAGFAVFWEINVLNDGAPFFFALWGLPFIAVGGYVTVGRFWVRAWSQHNTSYTVTTSRVIVVRGRSVVSEYLTALAPPVILERTDGSGDLAFGSMMGGFSPGYRHYGPDGYHQTGAWGYRPGTGLRLRDIAQVRRVRDIVASAQAAARSTVDPRPSGS